LSGNFPLLPRNGVLVSADTDLIDGVARLLHAHRSACKCGVTIDVRSVGRDGPDAAMLFAALECANTTGDFLRGMPGEDADLVELGEWKASEPQRLAALVEAYRKFGMR